MTSVDDPQSCLFAETAADIAADRRKSCGDVLPPPIVSCRPPQCGSVRLERRTTAASGEVSARYYRRGRGAPNERRKGGDGVKLYNQRASLQASIEEGEAILQAAVAPCRFYERLFDQAHRGLCQLLEARQCGVDVSKQALLAAYDRRMLAGHEWHPHREVVKHTSSWLHALREELVHVNGAISILERRR